MAAASVNIVIANKSRVGRDHVGSDQDGGLSIFRPFLFVFLFVLLGFLFFISLVNLFAAQVTRRVRLRRTRCGRRI
jgi:hypothetical protein